MATPILSAWLPALRNALGLKSLEDEESRSTADGSARCSRCGAPIDSRHAFEWCTRDLQPLDRVVAGGVHHGHWKRLLHQSKFSNDPEALDQLMARLFHQLDPMAGLPSPGATVIPIPSPWWRRGLRGGSHTDSAARQLSERYAWIVRRSLRLAPRAGSQRGATRDGRLASTGDRFLWIDQHLEGLEPLQDAQNAVILVDDVLTTGATLRSAAKAVRGGGEPVSVLWGLVLAVED
ncbi:MAG: hypothetical protein O2819_04045 [Planctomycetota bacterium]|nr:hypothetical protein [Planctomycetota bacterium]MDA1106667.1 hypothetical protein [Planctomycetota bacterium]